MKRICLAWVFLCVTATSLSSQSSSVPLINQSTNVGPPISAPQSNPKAQARILDTYGNLPLSFEANHGQTDGRVKFLSRTGRYSLFLTGDEAVLALSGKKTNADRAKIGSAAHTSQSMATTKAGGVLRMKLRNANLAAKVSGTDELAGTSNYFIGNDPAKWRTSVPTYAKVKYEGIYSGIDLVYYGNQRRLEYDFIVAPGADPHRIEFDVRGANRIRKDAYGELVFKVGEDEIRWHKPVVYQEKGGVRQLVPARYAISHTNRVGFELGKYDASRALYIDPLIYSTYLEGGLGGEKTVHLRGGESSAVAVDNEGNAYITGSIPYIIFPGDCGQPEKCAVYRYPFIAKLNPAATALIYSTYVGGVDSSVSIGNSIAVDSAGDAYITGQTDATDFPVTPGAFQTACGLGCDYHGNAFVAELNPTGSALVYSTYLGGSRTDGGAGIAVDSLGDAYVVGHTNSTDFPVTPGAFQTTCGNPSSCGNAFVTEMNPTGSALIYSTFLGGSGTDAGTGIALDGAGNTYVTGSAGIGFPTTSGAFQTKFGGNANAFVARLNATGSALVYSTYLGGSGGDAGNAIAVDSSDHAYVTGITNSTDFPVTPGAYQTTCGSCGDGFQTGSAFVAELNPMGSALVYSTYLGGSGEAYGAGIAVDSAGDAYVTGTAGVGFPTTLGAFQATCCGAFVTKFSPTGSFLYYSTYLDYGSGASIVVDGSGNAYVAGAAGNGFPTTKGVLQKNCDCGVKDSAYQDAFATKIDLLAATNTSLTSAPNPSPYGEAVTFTAVVSWSGGAPPDGENVSFMSGETVLGTGTLSGGSASFTTSALKVGTIPVRAVYSGDANFSGSTSAAVKQVVEKQAPPYGVVSPTAVNFGDVAVGQTSPTKNISLKNTGESQLKVSAISISGDFAIPTNHCAKGVEPETHCNVYVTFTPRTAGMLTGTLTFKDNASNSPQTVSLVGTGTN